MAKHSLTSKPKTYKQIERRKRKILSRQHARADKLHLYMQRPCFLETLFESVELPKPRPPLNVPMLTLPEIRTLIEKQRLKIQYNFWYNGPNENRTPKQIERYYKSREKQERQLVAAISEDELKSLVKQYWLGKVCILSSPSEIPATVLGPYAGLSSSTVHSTINGFDVKETVKKSNKDTGSDTNDTYGSLELNNETVQETSNYEDKTFNEPGQQSKYGYLGMQQGSTHDNIDMFSKKIRKRLLRKMKIHTARSAESIPTLGGQSNGGYLTTPQGSEQNDPDEVYTNILINKFKVKRLREQLRGEAVKASASMPQKVRRKFAMKHSSDQLSLQWALISAGEQLSGLSESDFEVYTSSAEPLTKVSGSRSEVEIIQGSEPNNICEVFNNLIGCKKEVKELRQEIRRQAVQATSMPEDVRAKIFMGRITDKTALRWAKVATRECNTKCKVDTVQAPVIKHRDNPHLSVFIGEDYQELNPRQPEYLNDIKKVRCVDAAANFDPASHFDHDLQI